MTAQAKKRTRRLWTKDEDDLLRQRYPNGATDSIAADMGRSTFSICSRASSLGLHKSDSFMAQKRTEDAQRLNETGAHQLRTGRGATCATSRRHLRSLKDRDDPTDIDRAKAINETAQAIIDSVNLEIARARTAGGEDIEPDLISVLPEAAQGAQQIGVATERQTQHGMEMVIPIQGGVVRRHVVL